ncbi:MAG: SH3 domain-containing protein [Pirellulales bacterium]
MRIVCAVLAFAVPATLVSGAVAGEFPYQAFVNASDVYVRSGPGRNYYPTDKLPRGILVEVWRHDPGGWYAIRPPEGSYSWVASKHLQIVENNIAEVRGDKVTAYVGSKFSDVHDVRQVQLKRGEPVEIVGEKRFVTPGAGATETWYKVAPPAGEFRWVFSRYVTRKGIAATTARHEQTKRSSTGGRPAWTDVSKNADDRYAQTAEYTESGSDVIRLASGEEPQKHSILATARSTNIEQLDLELSTIISDPPTEWQLDNLRELAKQALGRTRTALARGKARRLVNEIERYQALQDEYLKFDREQEDFERQNRLVAAAADIPPSDWRKISDIDVSNFDGLGKLTPVKSRRYGAPEYALTNPEGRVVMFVSPAQGMNMRRYIGKVVGVSGQRGFIPQLRKGHITVTHVEPIEPSVLVAKKPDGR